MKKIYRYLIIILMMISIFPISVNADNKYITTGEDIVEEENIDNTHFTFGNRVSINNQVDGIYFIFGEEVKYNTSNEYVALFGNRVSISGSIRDGIIFGNIVNLNDVNINRDIVIFGNEVNLSGEYNGNVVVYGNKVNIEHGKFLKDITIHSDTIEIGSDTVVSGVLRYNEDTKIANINYISNIKTEIITNKVEVISTKDKILKHVDNIVRLLVIFLLMYLLIPKIFDKISNKVGKNYLYGGISLIVLPLILLILLFTNYATSVAIIGIMLYVIFIMISKVLVGYILGKYIYTKIFKLEEKKYLCGILGIVIIYLLTLIPYIGVIITISNLIYSFGIISNMYLEYRK